MNLRKGLRLEVGVERIKDVDQLSLRLAVEESGSWEERQRTEGSQNIRRQHGVSEDDVQVEIGIRPER